MKAKPLPFCKFRVQHDGHGLLGVVDEPKGRHSPAGEAEIPHQPLFRSKTELAAPKLCGNQIQIGLFVPRNEYKKVIFALRVPQKQVFADFPHALNAGGGHLFNRENGNVLRKLIGDSKPVKPR
ncbi:hypothetical protein SDC9_90138 [bioreactor metagenome]|uniref:Uncharacterized protein n=1 Tax=bioreactor metagenome TaxID=1076179 RepID=A0A645A0W3_9ZZZZ